MITQELFAQWLSDNHCVYIVSKTDETSGLPNHLMENPLVMLQIGLSMDIAIPDLKVTDEAWSGTLSFSKRGRHIYCPFNAILQVSVPNEWGEQKIYSVPLTSSIAGG